MGGSAGGALAAAVSNAGGLGLVGGGRGNRDWLDRELGLVTTNTTAPWGVGFLCWAASVSAVEQALGYEPAAVMLSFGDPVPFVEPIRQTDAHLIVQVVDLDEAEQALDVGADIIVAQGTESGGHGARKGRSTLSFVPLVVDLAGDVPVLAAGGISDGRGIAAALCLGASGVLLGSRFQATHEALVDPRLTEAILNARGARTERTSVPDILLDNGWPRHYTGRTLSDRFIDEWRDREDELVSHTEMKEAYRVAMQRGEIPPVPVWINESVDLIRDTKPAATVVRELASQTERALEIAVGGKAD
jgi:nitronate monooxygenase